MKIIVDEANKDINKLSNLLVDIKAKLIYEELQKIENLPLRKAVTEQVIIYLTSTDDNL